MLQAVSSYLTPFAGTRVVCYYELIMVLSPGEDVRPVTQIISNYG